MALPTGYRDRFVETLAETGNVSRTAASLGITRKVAYDWRDREPAFAAAWDRALEVARAGLRERVVETACEMGLARMAPLLDAEGRPVLDDDFEPVLVADTSHVDARVLMKLMDKTMRSEDGPPVVAVQSNVTVGAEPEVAIDATPLDLDALLAGEAADG